MNIAKRAKAPLPDLFKKLRNTGLILITAGSSVLASQWEVTHGLIDIAGYITLAGGVLSAVSQLTVKDAVITLNEKNHEYD